MGPNQAAWEHFARELQPLTSPPVDSRNVADVRSFSIAAVRGKHGSKNRSLIVKFENSVRVRHIALLRYSKYVDILTLDALSDRVMPIKMETGSAAAASAQQELPEIKSEIKVEDFCVAATGGAASESSHGGAPAENVAVPQGHHQQQQQQHPQMHHQPNPCNWVGDLFIRCEFALELPRPIHSAISETGPIRFVGQGGREEAPLRKDSLALREGRNHSLPVRSFSCGLLPGVHSFIPTYRGALSI